MTDLKETRTLTFIQEIRTLSHLKGSRDVIDVPQWLFNFEKNQLEFVSLRYPPALPKSIDEVIVNAEDHAYETRKLERPARTTYIKIFFDEKTGALTVINNGEGIPYQKIEVDAETHQQMYIAEAIASVRSTTSNSVLNKGYDPDLKVTGGVNGLGLKTAVADSRQTLLETIDIGRKIFYRQLFRPDDIKIRAEPALVVDLTNTAAKRAAGLVAADCVPHTKIVVDIDYKLFDFDLPEQRAVIGAWVRNRAYQCAASVSRLGVEVYYNDKRVVANLSRDFGVEAIATELTHPLHPWSVYVVPTGPLEVNHYSLVDGIFAKDGGGHITFLQRQLVDGLRERVEKLVKKHGGRYTPDLVKNNVLIAMVGNIPIPGWASWDSQSKTRLEFAEKVRDKLAAYKLTEDFLGALWKRLEPLILETISAKTRRTSTLSRMDKYEAADFRETRAADRMLFVAEGDSALGMVKKIIHKNPRLGFKRCGTLSVRGVPMNSRKEAKIQYGVGGRRRVVDSAKLRAHEAFATLRQAMNLNDDFTYETEKERNTLNYHSVIIASDQDTDGMHICALILDFLMLRWPALTAPGRSMIKRYVTPVIRIVDRRKNSYREFFNVPEFNEYVEKHPLTSSQRVKYYKGLGAHDTELDQMANDFFSNVYAFELDPGAEELAAKILGEDTDFRKVFLSTPITHVYPPEVYRRRAFPISLFLQIDVKQYYLACVARKMLSAIDGLIPAQRKVFAGARQLFARDNEEIRVYQMAGDIAKRMCYAHGDGPLGDVITKMGQCFKGAKTLPLLRKVGDFGTAEEGTDRSASTRYISASLNKPLTDLLFPLSDDWMLQYLEEEGQICEPTYYLPIIPLALLEHSTTTSVGWKISVFARDYKVVINEVRRIVRGTATVSTPLQGVIQKPIRNRKPAAVELRFCGSSNSRRTSECCFGKWFYDEDENTIYITELPLRVWTKKFCDDLRELSKCDKCRSRKKKDIVKKCAHCGNVPIKKHIEEVRSLAAVDDVDIRVMLKPGGFEKIMEEAAPPSGVHPIEHYLGMRQPMKADINMVDAIGTVRTFESYEAVLNYWLPLRRAAYERRLAREILIAELRLIYLDNLIRFISAVDEYEMNKKTASEQETLLRRENYVPLRPKILDKPGTRDGEALREAFMGAKASFAYLDLRISETTKEALAKHIARREEIRAELARLKLETPANIWLRELDALEKIIAEGIATDWLFGDPPRKA